MKTIQLCVWCVVMMTALPSPSESKALPLDAAHWEDRNPLGGEFRDGKYECLLAGNSWNVRAKDAPVSSNITVTAEFTPTATDGDSYKTAAVALYESPRRMWHLALLDTPAPNSRHVFELHELRDGTWCSEGSLKIEVDEARGGWTFGETYRLSLTMDGSGVEGVVTAGDGRTLFRRRHRLAPGAVGCGSPALKGYAIRGTYANVSVAWQGEVPPTQVAETAPSDAGAGPFWRLAQDGEGRWNFVSPEGRADFLAGCSTVGWQGDYNFKLGYAPYGRAVRKKYGTPEKWAKACERRLKEWGFSYATASAEFYNNTDFPYSRIVAIGQDISLGDGEFCILPCDGGPCTAFPNVFSSKWEAYCRYRAQTTCAPARNDRRLVGWFIDNELSWWGDARKFRTPPARGLYDAAIRRPAGHSARAAAEALAKSRGFDDPSTADAATRLEFVRLCAERYFSIAAKAIREADPNHLVLGCRFAGIRSSDPVVWEECGKYCDALSVNLYPVADLTRGAIYNGGGVGAQLAADALAEVHRRCGKPLMITEWSFSALDSGVPCLHGAGQRFFTQRERAKAVELFAKTMYGLPFMSGYLFFKWSDQPYYGRKSEASENTNYGLVNADDEPYPEVTSVLKEIQTNGAKWRRTPPPAGGPVVPRDPAEHARALAKPSAAAPVFTRGDDGAFTLDAGALRITGKKGETGLCVNGVAKFSTTVREYSAGHIDWNYASVVEDVQCTVADGVAVLDVTFSGKVFAGPFRVVERLHVPAGCGFFLAEHRAVENHGTKPLPFDQVFFRLVPIDCTSVRSAPDGFIAPPKDGQPTPIPPTLWRPWRCGVWLTPDAYCGVATPRETEVSVRYWKDRNMHTDAQITVGRSELRPGARYAFSTRPYVIGAAAKGGHADWTKIFAEIRAK